MFKYGTLQISENNGRKGEGSGPESSGASYFRKTQTVVVESQKSLKLFSKQVAQANSGWGEEGLRPGKEWAE